MVEAAVNDGEGKFWIFALHLVLLSFLAIGGIAPILPEMHRQAVDVHGFMTSERFRDLFAIAQASPGPNFLVVALLGFDIAGVPGALVAITAITAPTCILAYWVAILWAKFRQARWRRALQAGLIPVAIGLVAASAFVIARMADTNLVAFGITVVTTLGLYFTKLHPFLFLAAAGAIGFAGFL